MQSRVVVPLGGVRGQDIRLAPSITNPAGPGLENERTAAFRQAAIEAQREIRSIFGFDLDNWVSFDRRDLGIIRAIVGGLIFNSSIPIPTATATDRAILRAELTSIRNSGSGNPGRELMKRLEVVFNVRQNPPGPAGQMCDVGLEESGLLTCIDTGCRLTLGDPARFRYAWCDNEPDELLRCNCNVWDIRNVPWWVWAIAAAAAALGVAFLLSNARWLIQLGLSTGRYA
jgi:hypothetical protein